MKSLTSRLYLSNQTVFTTQEIALFWQESHADNLKSKINYYCTSGVLKRLRRGLYALAEKPYDRHEVANRIFIPSYISLETVLAAEGLIFQYDTTIYSISYQTRQVTIDNQTYNYRRVASDILTNPMGLIHNGATTIASKERAFLDLLYLSGAPHIDRTNGLDWNICRNLLPMYHNTALNKRFAQYA